MIIETIAEQSKSLSAIGSRNAPYFEATPNFLAKKPSKKSVIAEMVKSKNDKKYNSKKTEKIKINGPKKTLVYVSNITNNFIFF